MEWNEEQLLFEAQWTLLQWNARVKDLEEWKQILPATLPASSTATTTGMSYARDHPNGMRRFILRLMVEKDAVTQKRHRRRLLDLLSPVPPHGSHSSVHLYVIL